MLTYEPGATVAHRLDPRSKLAFQVGFAVLVFTTSSLATLGVLAGVAAVSLLAARLSPVRALRAYWFLLVVLALGPVLGGLALGPPWFRVDGAVTSLWRVVRIVPLLFVSAAFVHSTPVRDTRAAIQRTVPGRLGQLLGVGVGLTFRFVPILRADVSRIRTAIRVRGGETRPLRERVTRITTLAVVRAFRRGESLSTALRARCFAYNPTLPALRFGPADYVVVVAAAALAGVGFWL
jgi:biotin transport system permease protein